jgi:dihydrolipoamide dehydrogenase
MTPQLLPGVDRDLVRVLHATLKPRLEEILLETKVESVRLRNNEVEVNLVNSESETQQRVFDRVLVAIGRRPDSSRLGLENTVVEVDDRGFIRVDGRRRTSDERIFAIGDVAGEPLLAHKAAHEGRVAAEVIAGRPAAYDPAAVPAVVFTEPEIAWAGLTEAEAKRQEIAVRVSRFPWAASGRAATLGGRGGLTKLLIDPRNERILGVGIAGSQAGEMIAEAVLALEMGANVTDLALTVHPHPTLSETLMEAAESFHGTATHQYRPKRK